MNFLVDVNTSIAAEVQKWCQQRFSRDCWSYDGTTVLYGLDGELRREYARFWFHRYEDATECKMVWL